MKLRYDKTGLQRDQPVLRTLIPVMQLMTARTSSDVERSSSLLVHGQSGDDLARVMAHSRWDDGADTDSAYSNSN